MINGKFVLVVEDDPTIGIGLTTVLRQSGAAQVKLVAGYIRALRWLRERGTPDLVITDYRLVDSRTGVDLALWIRVQPDMAHMPCILYSSTDQSTIRAELALRVAQNPGLAGMTLETLFRAVVTKHPSHGPLALIEVLQNMDSMWGLATIPE